MNDNPTFWYKANKHKAHEHVFSHVEGVERDQSALHEANLIHAKLYSNRDEPGLGEQGRHAYRSGWAGVTENVIQSVVDTATSLIAKSRPKATFQTTGGEWSMQQLARRLEKYVLGMFQALEIHDKMANVFRDACIFGTGALKLYTRRGQIKAERVLIDEIVVDEDEVRNGGHPRQLHQVKMVAREVLKGLYPNHEKDIEESGQGHRTWANYKSVDPDMVVCVESWYVPQDGKGGRHTICVDEATLVDEDWSRDCFPFVFYHWNPPVTGWYGQGLAESLLGFQIRINELNDFIQRCQDLVAVPRVAVDAGSKLMKVQMDNTIGAIIPYVGNKPEFFTPQALNTEVYAYKEQLKNSAFEFAGISKMAAQATRPEGIEAAVALRELSDNQSQRFSIQQSRYEKAFMQVAEHILELAKQLHGQGTEPPSVFMAERFVETIDWPEVDFEKNRFVLHIAPSSMLSETPSGKLQKVIELAQYGVPIEPDQIRRLLGDPDIELSDERATSQLEDIEWTIEKLSDPEEDFISPEPFQDLQKGVERVTAAYLDARRAEAPEEVLEKMRQWIELASDMLAESQAAAQPQVPPDAMQQTALPGMGASAPAQMPAQPPAQAQAPIA